MTADPARPERLIALVDPAADDHPALARALISARIRQPHAELLVLVTPDPDAEGAARPVCRNRLWLDTLLDAVEASGIAWRCELLWAGAARSAILEQANAFDADLILVPAQAPVGTRRELFSDARWTLLRGARCPVLSVRPGAPEQRRVVLAALKAQSESPDYARLNRRIADRARWMAARYGAALHVVNACRDLEDFPDRALLLELAGVANDHVHVEVGAPDKVIAETAERLDADIVVVGTLARSGLTAALRGNTAERIIARLPRDVMTLT